MDIYKERSQTVLLKDEEIKARRKKRYSYVTINLWLKINNEWEMIEAHDWNEDGFNFHLSEKIKDSQVLFKKDSKQFYGNTVWELKHEEDDAIKDIVLNKLIFTKVMKLTDNENTTRRILGMARTLGILEEKRGLLDLFGIEIPDEEIESMVKKYKSDFQLYRYGVKVEAQEWAEIVMHTLETEPEK